MQIQRLLPKEAAQLDPNQLDFICHQMGTGNGEAAVCAVMENLAELIYSTEIAWENGDFPGLRANCLQIRAMSEQIGMTTLVMVALDVIGLCAGDDGNALAATVSRLQRVGERSLLAVWDAQDGMI